MLQVAEIVGQLVLNAAVCGFAKMQIFCSICVPLFLVVFSRESGDGGMGEWGNGGMGEWGNGMLLGSYEYELDHFPIPCQAPLFLFESSYPKSNLWI